MASTTTKAIVAVGAIALIAFGVLAYQKVNDGDISSYKPGESQSETSVPATETPATITPSPVAPAAPAAPAPSDAQH